MDYCNTDPMFGSAVYQDVMSSIPSSMLTSQNMGVIDFDSYSRPTMLEPNDIEMAVDSPTSESYPESDDASILGFRDSVTSPCDMEDESKPSPSSSSSSQGQMDSFLDDKFNADRTLVMSRWGPHDVFPADKSWTLEQKAAKLIELSPCHKYTVNDLMNIDSLEKAEDRVAILIEIVAGIKVNFRWNYVSPHELFKSYTVVTNCKKEKEKKDAEGNPIPKRPMNAFMIWCQKCRTLMAHICPQLHNAIISKALGAAWKKFTAEERAEYEEQKIKLMAFHQHEFPDYKYRPKKKPKKSDEKASPAAKPRSKKKAANASMTASDKAQSNTMLRGINIADEARQSLDPLLKERLQVKMQVKIDSELKRGIGKRATAIDLADLTGFQSDFASLPSTSSSTSPTDTGLYIDSHSSVFDTPENSPQERPTQSPNGIIANVIGGKAYTTADKTTAFTFDDKLSIQLQLDNNNSTTIANNNNIATVDNNNVISLNHNLNLVVDLPQSSSLDGTAIVKTEPRSSTASPELATVFWPNIKVEPSEQCIDQPVDQTLKAALVEQPMADYQPMWATNNNVIKPELKQEPGISDNAGVLPILSVEDLQCLDLGSMGDNPANIDDLGIYHSPYDPININGAHVLNESTSQFIIENTLPAPVGIF